MPPRQSHRDSAMNAYVHKLFFEGEGIFAARMAVYGFAHLQVLNLRDPLELPLARKALAGYKTVAPDRQRDPCPWEAVLLLSDWLLSTGVPVDAEAAKATIISFEAYTRPSELLGVRCQDVILVEYLTVLACPAVSLRIAPLCARAARRK